MSVHYAPFFKDLQHNLVVGPQKSQVLGFFCRPEPNRAAYRSRKPGARLASQALTCDLFPVAVDLLTWGVFIGPVDPWGEGGSKLTIPTLPSSEKKIWISLSNASAGQKSEFVHNFHRKPKTFYMFGHISWDSEKKLIRIGAENDGFEQQIETKFAMFPKCCAICDFLNEMAAFPEDRLDDYWMNT